MKNRKSSVLTYLYITMVVILWGFSFTWTNTLIHLGVPVLIFTFIRILIAGIVLAAVTLLIRKFNSIRKKDIGWFLLLGLFEPFLYFLGETYGLKATDSPTLSAVIVSTIPVFTMISAQIFYKESISRSNILGVVLTLPGVLMLVYTPGGITAKYAWGILLLFLAVFSSVGYATVAKKLSDRYNDLTITAAQFMIGAVYFLPIMLIFNGSDLKDVDFSKGEFWNAILNLSLICSALCFFLYIKTIREIGLTRAAIFTALIPGFAAFASFLKGFETFSLLKLSGIAIVITGVILAQRKKRPASGLPGRDRSSRA